MTVHGRMQRRRSRRADILPLGANTRKVRAERRARARPRASATGASRSARSSPSISRTTTRCGCRCTRCCYIEKGGEEQIADELAAYNPLIPQGPRTGRHVHDRDRRSGPAQARPGDARRHRAARLHRRSAASGSAACRKPIRTAPTSRGQGLLGAVRAFPLHASAIAKFRAPGARVTLGFDHPAYAHMTVMPEAVRAELAEDFD